MLTNISPIDGRYASKTKDFKPYFSEFGLQKYRIRIEVEYFIALCETEIAPLRKLTDDEKTTLRNLYQDFSEENGMRIKEIESTTNHDVKAIEYFIKENIKDSSLGEVLEFIHFGLTSQDINNTSIPLLMQEATHDVFLPTLHKVLGTLQNLANDWKSLPLLARTHGQPASPTTLGKEIKVFAYRLNRQIQKLESIKLTGKFGGATGNFNAHYVAYPNNDWPAFAKNLVENILGLEYSEVTTQIDDYDLIAEWCQILVRINSIVIDLDRDIWQYISHEIFGLKTIAGEVGSSAMPHKVNPIDFENSEGNLGISTALLQHFVEKLPVSRLQRDLTDSTVLRNIGVPMSHSLIALQSTLKGLSKLEVRKDILSNELNNHWAVVSEAIQTVLRREGYEQPYEALKALTRGKGGITEESMHNFINELSVSDTIKEELLKITPENYIGNANQ